MSYFDCKLCTLISYIFRHSYMPMCINNVIYKIFKSMMIFMMKYIENVKTQNIHGRKCQDFYGKYNLKKKNNKNKRTRTVQWFVTIYQYLFVYDGPLMIDLSSKKKQTCFGHLLLLLDTNQFNCIHNL